MSVRAKFRVHNIKDQGAGLAVIELHPVYSSDPQSENAKFFDATPWGSIQLGTVNAAAAEQFKAGGEFYVDFTPAETA
jgi:hypothetical protein